MLILKRICMCRIYFSFGICICILYLCMCSHVCRWAHLFVCMSSSIILYLIRWGRISQLNPELTVLLDTLLQRCFCLCGFLCLNFSSAKITSGPLYPPIIYLGSEDPDEVWQMLYLPIHLPSPMKYFPVLPYSLFLHSGDKWENNVRHIPIVF